jgi:hypothetical protein
MRYKLIEVPEDPLHPRFNLSTYLAGHKTYLVLAVSAAKVWYVATYGHPWSDQVDNAINDTLALLGVASLRSALKSSTAQISNAVVNPASPVAKAVAAQAQPPPA